MGENTHHYVVSHYKVQVPMFKMIFFFVFRDTCHEICYVQAWVCMDDHADLIVSEHTKMVAILEVKPRPSFFTIWARLRIVL